MFRVKIQNCGTYKEPRYVNYSQRKRQSADANLNLTQMLQLSDTDIKAAVITLLHEIKANNLK